MSKVSIIVPIYNVAPYLRQCLDSVASQTYKDLEVLLVDDCGTDDSMEIAESFATEYTGPIDFRILHHTHNRGLSAARNTGIEASTGEYLFFLDSDDWISDDCIETLFEAIHGDEGIEMAVGNVSVIGDEWNLLRMSAGLYDKELWTYYSRWLYYVPVWNKLIWKKFILDNKLYFEEGLIHEDYLWSFQAACRLQKIAISEKVTYFYLRREGSLDNLPQKRIHNINYGKACALQAEYALKSFHTMFKKSAFEYVERQRIHLILQAIENEDKEEYKEQYRILRTYPYWGPFFMTLRRCTKGAIMRSFHRFLPYRLGEKYYWSVTKKYGY